MQISTRTEDFIVDTLKLHNYLGENLREVFQDPTKKKVDLVFVIYFFFLFIPNIQFLIAVMKK
jgi:hypothetical protein